MNKKLLFFLCNVMTLSYASDRFSSSPVRFLDMCTVDNQRLENLDRRVFCRLPGGGCLFGVLDGHVTSEVAEETSRTFPGSFQRYLSSSLSVSQAFTQAFNDAEQYALNNLEGGSTALFVYSNNGVVDVAHVGDSRAVFGGKNGIAFATHDQIPDRKDERERIERAGGKIYKDKNALNTSIGPSRINHLAMSRSIGDRMCKINDQGIINNQVIAEPEHAQLSLTDAHCWLIMASDGLWDAVGSEDAVTIVQSYYDTNSRLNGVASLLCDYAINAGSKDNITVLVIDLLNQACKKTTVSI